MATPAEIQAIGDPANTMHVYKIQNSTKINVTYDAHYVVGITAPYAGKAKWCQTTSAGDATAQNAEIVAALVL